MNPLVSIIVPNYNHAPYLKQRMESLLTQSYANIEIILLDDCSEDHSVDIINTYQSNPKVSHIIINSTNSGSPFIQWKKGIEFAKGDFIWIAESDDYAAPTFLAELMPALINDPKIGISYAQSYVVNSKNEILFENKQWTDDLDQKKWSTNYTNTGKEECINYLLFKNIIPNASAVVFRKKFISDLPLNFKLIGDWYFWIILLLKSDLSFTAKPLNYFRLLDSASRNHNTQEKRLLRVKEGFKIVTLLKPYITQKAYQERFNFHFKWHLSILPIKKLCTLSETSFNGIKIKRTSLIKFTFLEIINRMIKKMN